MGKGEGRKREGEWKQGKSHFKLNYFLYWNVRVGERERERVMEGRGMGRRERH